MQLNLFKQKRLIKQPDHYIKIGNGKLWNEDEADLIRLKKLNIKYEIIKI